MRRIDPFLMSFAEQVKEQTAAWNKTVLTIRQDSKLTSIQRDELRFMKDWSTRHITAIFTILGRWDLVAELGLLDSQWIPFEPFIMVVPMKDSANHGRSLGEPYLVINAKEASMMDMSGEVSASHVRLKIGEVEIPTSVQIDGFFATLPEQGVQYLLGLPAIKEQLASFLTDELTETRKEAAE